MIADNVVGILRSLRMALRSEVEPTALADTVRARIRALDPALPVTSVQTMSDIVQQSAAVPRFNALLVSLFAVLALLLAAIGVGGMLAMSVSRRLPELGVGWRSGRNGDAGRNGDSKRDRPGCRWPRRGAAGGLAVVTRAVQPVVRDQSTDPSRSRGRDRPGGGRACRLCGARVADDASDPLTVLRME